MDKKRKAESKLRLLPPLPSTILASRSSLSMFREGETVLHEGEECIFVQYGINGFHEVVIEDPLGVWLVTSADQIFRP